MRAKVLLTGANGQLGRAFQEVAAGDEDLVVVPVYRELTPGVAGRVLDLAEPGAAARCVHEERPDWIVHAGAFTNVDGCEREPERARRVNAEATGELAAAAADVGARMAYVSTDYVFDGERGAYREDDPTHPVQVYGATKLEGERLAREALGDDLVVARPSVVFGPHRGNFVTWLVTALRDAQSIRLVEDQRVSPTLTTDLSRMLLALMDADAQGTYHAAGASGLSRLEMAEAVANVFGSSLENVTPVKLDAFDWLARRPRDTTLDVAKVTRVRAPLAFRDALEEFKAHPALADVIS